MRERCRIDQRVGQVVIALASRTGLISDGLFAPMEARWFGG